MFLEQQLIDLDSALSAPLFSALLQVLYCTVNNLILYKFGQFLQRYKDRSYLFSWLSYSTGILELYLFSTLEKTTFVVITSFIYGAFFFTATWVRHMHQELIKRLDGILKVFAFGYAIVIYRTYHEQSDFGDYIVTFYIMTTKLISAGVSMRRYTYEQMKKPPHKNNPTSVELAAYVIHSGWPTFRDYLHLRGTSTEPNLEWKKMAFRAGSKSILFKILSHKPLEEQLVALFVQICDTYKIPLPQTTGFFPWFYPFRSIFYAFQFRCRYYFQVQLAEMQVIISGLKSGNWNKYFVYDFIGAEFSIVNSDFFVCSNMPLGYYIRNQFKMYSDSGQWEAYINLGALVILALCCHVYKGVYILLFMFSMYTQNASFLSYTLVGKCDCHMYGVHPNFGLTKPKSYIRCCNIVGPFIVFNQIRLATLFYPFQLGRFLPSIIILVFSISFDIIFGRLTRDLWKPPPGGRRRNRNYYNC